MMWPELKGIQYFKQSYATYLTVVSKTNEGAFILKQNYE